jgi:hypothetical protein
MAAVTSAIIGAGTAAYSMSQSIKSGKEKRAAARAIAEQKAPELTNIGEGLQVSTLGSDLAKEEQGRLAASQVNAAQEAGTRGVIGSVGKIAAQNQAVNAQAAADLDRQQKEIDSFRAQDEGNIRGLKEQRFRDKLAALSSQYNSANQMQQQNIGNVISGTGYALGSLSASNKNSANSESGFKAPQGAYDLPKSIY